MITLEKAYQNIIEILDSCNAEYKLFSHKAALSYDELEEARKDTGFEGTEGKCMVLKINDSFVVYVTTASKRINFDKIKESLGTKKVRMATKEELKDNFGAEPGCAYPFGFENDIYVDPEIYNQDRFLFSPALPTKTVQIEGNDLKKIFNSLKNKVTETANFNA